MPLSRAASTKLRPPGSAALVLVLRARGTSTTAAISAPVPSSARKCRSEKTLSEQGLAWHQAAPGTDAFVCSTPERAMLEFCDGIAGATLVYEADALMQAMTTLRPQRVSLLLRYCRSIKAKRVFLALAERHRHAWLSHVSLDGVDLGRGKRALVPGGRLHPTYQITLPGDLDEHLA